MNFRNRYLLYSSFVLLTTGCTSQFKDLTRTDGPPCSVSKFKPSIEYSLYTASVDILHKHLSGLLVLKTMPDKSTRAVFQSEMGLTFFDFEWAADGTFRKMNVLRKMDKKVVVNALRKDFELLLMNRLDTTQAITFTDGHQLYTRFPDDSEFVYAITDAACTALTRMERASSRKAKVDLYLTNTDGVPDSVFIDHKQFKFTIALKRIR